jgi:hypothetical protein
MTPEPLPPVTIMPPLPGTPAAPLSNIARAQRAKMVNVPARYVYSHTSLLCAELCTLDLHAQDSQQYIDFDPDMLTEEGASTG